MSQNKEILKSTLRTDVLDFKAYTAGLSIEEIQERYGLNQVVKLASNENPLGTSPVVQRVLRDKADMAFRYPQSGNPRLAQALADRLGVSKECVVLGNGSDEIIDLLIRVRATPGKDNIVAFDPCFSMYKLQAKLCGVEFRQAPLHNDFTFPWDALRAQVDENTAIVFVTSPDNPSGYAAPVSEIRALAKALPETCLLVIDEAYIEFATPAEDYSLLVRGEAMDYANVVTLRTFSKLYGLAGLRLGYGVMPAWLADYLWRVRMPFSVNILAEEAGLAALEDEVFYQATLECVLLGREFLKQELEALGCKVYPTQTNFLLYQLPPSTDKDAKQVFEALLAKGVIIRPLTSYGLVDCLRLSIGTPAENKIFLQAFKEVL